MIVTLLQGSGNSFRSITFDTIVGGCFSFKYTVPAGFEMPNSMGISAYSKEWRDKQNKFQYFWAPEGITTIKGDGYNIRNWIIENNSAEQTEENALKEASTKYTSQLAAIDDQLDSCGKQEKFRTMYDSLKTEKNQIINLIGIEQLQYLDSKQNITKSGLKKLASITLFGLKYGKKMLPYRDQILCIYNKLNTELKQSPDGVSIATILHPKKVLVLKDTLPEDILCDTLGLSYTMHEYRGKHILVDIWSSSCGPCIKANNELRDIQQKYANKLTVIGINVDGKENWKRASKQHKISWINLSDGMGQNAGFCSNFAINGIPHYILANEQGVIIKI